MLVINKKNKKKKNKNDKILTVFHDNGAKFDNVVVDTIKLILLNYSNFSVAKIIVKKIEKVKLTLSLLVSRSGMFKRLDKKQEGGELVLSNKINTLKFFQNLSIKSNINFFKHNNR